MPTPFPTSFSEASPAPFVDPLLEGREFTITTGFPPEALTEMIPIANSEAVREFCPKDSLERFGDGEMAERWLKKGRELFLLRDMGNKALAGYGWTGSETSEHVPDADTTFAVRLSPAYAGRGLAPPFTRSIVASSRLLHGGSTWLETWRSNEAAIRTYLKAGAVLVSTMDADRPSLEQTEPYADIRWFMRFTNRTRALSA